MYDETLIEQLAELRAAVFTSNMMLLSILEQSGCDPEALITTIDRLMTNTANMYEDGMRKANGLEPRTKPRDTTLSMRLDKRIMDSIDWSGMKEN